MADSSIFERSGWLGTRARPLLNDWEHTRAATQLATRLLEEEEDDGRPRDIGREVGNHTRELFVSCDPADALLQQFERLVPSFIAVHDVGTRNARKLLSGIAAASGRPMQKLIIRRQGHGTTLASIDFIDCEADSGRAVRMYSTEIDADTVTRVALARSLMAHAHMTVLMVGDLPAHALSAALHPLREAVLKGPWPCRHLLFLPLALSPSLTALASDFSIATAIEVKTAPKVTRPAEAWAYLGATWNRSQSTDYGPGQALLLQPLKGNPATAADPAGGASAPAAGRERSQAVFFVFHGQAGSRSHRRRSGRRGRHEGASGRAGRLQGTQQSILKSSRACKVSRATACLTPGAARPSPTMDKVPARTSGSRKA